MKKLSLLLLPFLLINCKNNENPSPPDEPEFDSAAISFFNLAGDEGYMFLTNRTPYTILPKDSLYSGLYFFKAPDTLISYRVTLIPHIDTTFFSFRSKKGHEYAGLLSARNSFGAYISNCIYPPKNKAYIKMLSKGDFKWMEITDSKNSRVIKNANGPFTNHDVLHPEDCHEYPPGKYNIYFYTDTVAPPVLSKTGVDVQAGKVYYVYASKKNEVFVMKR